MIAKLSLFDQDQQSPPQTQRNGLELSVSEHLIC